MSQPAERRDHWHSTLTYLGSSRYENEKRFPDARAALQDAEENRKALERGGLVVHTALTRVASTVQRHLAVDEDGNQVAVIEVRSCARPACAPAGGTGETERPAVAVNQVRRGRRRPHTQVGRQPPAHRGPGGSGGSVGGIGGLSGPGGDGFGGTGGRSGPGGAVTA